MKLELKHIAPYLPYGLKVCIMGENVEDKPIIFELVGLDTNCVEYHEIGRTVTEQIIFKDCFPILHPLSDLTKEIEVNGEKFVPIENFGFTKEYEVKFYQDGRYFYVYRNGIHCIAPQGEMLDRLFQWHFDVFGLIPKGLAIDINTLSND